MRHRKKVPKLNRTAAHRDAMLRNLATDLLRHERVTTTLAKAKVVRPLAERMVTLGKRDTLHARRRAARVIRDADVVRKVFQRVGATLRRASRWIHPHHEAGDARRRPRGNGHHRDG